MKHRRLLLLSLVVLMVGALVIPAAAQEAPPVQNTPPPSVPRRDPASGLQQDENGLWRRNAGGPSARIARRLRLR